MNDFININGVYQHKLSGRKYILLAVNRNGTVRLLSLRTGFKITIPLNKFKKYYEEKNKRIHNASET